MNKLRGFRMKISVDLVKNDCLKNYLIVSRRPNYSNGHTYCSTKLMSFSSINTARVQYI